MKVAILGAGNVARALGSVWQKAGHEVVLGTRRVPDDDPGLPVTGLQEAIAGSDVVVNAITGAASLAAITALDTTALDGKTLLDVGNARTPAGELIYPNSSLAEHLQQALPQAHVVKSLNTAPIEVLADPASLPGPATVFISGDHEGAKTETRALLHDLGWTDSDIIDLGGIRTARGPEHYFILVAAAASALKTRKLNLRIIR
jgi:8-hydroxy-5-deazaflavin:NADPH oxidoreductase